MAKSPDLNYVTEYPSVEQPHFVTDYAETAGKNDGWLAGLLLFSLIFGPRAINPGLLPPIRSADGVVILLVAIRWAKSSWIGRGFLFAPANRIFSGFMLMLAFFLVFSTIINIAAGLYSFFIKDFFQPIVFIRMALIAAVMASFRFGEKQLKQLVIVLLVISLMLIALAFAQKYIYWRVSGLVERLYGIQWTELTVGERVGKRVGGTFGNSNVFSLCLVMLSAVSLSIALNMKRLWRLLAMVTFVGLGLAVLVGTASRTGVLALVMVSGILLLLSFHGKSRVPAFIFMILLFVVLSLFLEHAQELPLHPRIKELVGEGGPIKTINEKLHVRYTMWQERWGEIKESPIWGQGERKMYRQLADNGYVVMLLRMGVIGLSVYLFMLFSLLVRGKRALRIEERRFQRTLLLASFMVLINHTIFELTGDFFWNVEYSAIFAAFMGLLCGLSAQARLEQDYLVYYDYEYATEAETYQTTADPLAGGQHDAYEHI